MPWRDGGNRTTMQFLTFTQMPMLVYRACLRSGKVSNTHYIQHAICEALARDLDIPLEELLAELPPPREPNNRAWAQAQRYGPANTVEEVR